jgi:hypothetical protein
MLGATKGSNVSLTFASVAVEVCKQDHLGRLATKMLAMHAGSLFCVQTRQYDRQLRSVAHVAPTAWRAASCLLD